MGTGPVWLLGRIAQLVEHRTEDPGVDGSSPSPPTRHSSLTDVTVTRDDKHL